MSKSSGFKHCCILLLDKRGDSDSHFCNSIKNLMSEKGYLLCWHVFHFKVIFGSHANFVYVYLNQ